MPTGVQWYTLGRTSAVPLQNLTLIVHCPEQGHTSEDLLQLHSLTQVAGQKILLVKGKGGRDLLQHNLMQRGAYVTLLELYQRVGINYPLSVINQILMEWRPDAIVMLSGETIGQFRSLSRELGYVGERHPSQQVTVVVPGKRVAAIAEAFNYRTIIASSAEDNEILQTIGETLPVR
jgi:uroporphyrinogen-III synthase